MGSAVEHEYWAPCPQGFEAVCADELRGMGISRVRPLKSGVTFFGPLSAGYRACLWSRTASRILLVLDRVAAADADELYASIYAMPWEDHVRADGSIRIDASGMTDTLRNTQFTAVRVKDAICDRFREKCGLRPDVDTHDPDLRVNVSLHGKRATVSVDLAGEALQRRGYRAVGSRRGSVASCRETIAAGMLLLAGWAKSEGGTRAFCDPRCGDGTLLIEAALIAGDVAPGILRTSWGFDRWLGHDEDTWMDILDEADQRSETGRAHMPAIVGMDMSVQARRAAYACIRAAGLADVVTLLSSPDAPDEDTSALERLAAAEGGLIATVAPHGGRFMSDAQMPAYYAQLSTRLREAGAGWELAVLSADETIDARMGRSSALAAPIRDGRDDVVLHVYRDEVETADETPVADASAETQAVPGYAITVRDTIIHVAEKGTEQFAARLKKVYAQRRKWARKAGVSCYRVYDADLPDYAVAIDLYEGAGRSEGKTYVQVAEYAAPSEIDPAKAQRRLADVLAVVPVALDVPAGRVFCKVRRHARGGSQYADVGEGRSVRATILEDYLKFEVNFTDYLDTGIFLDHRVTRELIFEEADRARFLNLFAYTGTATVHAAAGGAFSTTTVDLSQTYLDWAKRNMAMNGFEGEAHEFVRADCVQWVHEMRHSAMRWDLIFADVPTFSNSSSSRVRDWDVQRDHVEFLIDVSRLLTREGSAIFSCNLRSFKPDTEALAKAGVELEDMTAQTIPEDFARNPKIHHCYRLRRVS